MTALVHKDVRSFDNNAAVARSLRVMLSSGNVAAAGITDDEIGVMEELSLAGDTKASVRLVNYGETVRLVAAGAVSQYAEVYPAASGKISATVTGARWGIALEAASGDGSEIEVLRLPAGGASGGIIAEEVTFTEAGDTTYTGSVNVPAGAWIHDVVVQAVALWDDGTSASLKVGDASDDDGFYTGVDLKATDLTAEQNISFAAQGGVGGAYLTEGTNTHFKGLYNASARVISGVVTTGGQDGTAGRTRMVVLYSVPNSVAATGA